MACDGCSGSCDRRRGGSGRRRPGVAWVTLVGGLFAGLLIWSKLRLVGDVPLTAYADDPVAAMPEDGSPEDGVIEDGPDGRPGVSGSRPEPRPGGSAR